MDFSLELCTLRVLYLCCIFTRPPPDPDQALVGLESSKPSLCFVRCASVRTILTSPFVRFGQDFGSTHQITVLRKGRAIVTNLVLSPLIQHVPVWHRIAAFSGDSYVLFGLSTIVFCYGGWPFLRGLSASCRAAFRRQPIIPWPFRWQPASPTPGGSSIRPLVLHPCR